MPLASGAHLWLLPSRRPRDHVQEFIWECRSISVQWRSPGAGAAASCSSATCSRPWNAAALRRRRARSMPCCAASMSAVVGWPVARHLFARAQGAGLAGTSASHRSCCSRTEPAGARLHRRRRAAHCEAERRPRLFPLGQGRACASCTAPASATTISPRSRTGCAAPTVAPISPISSLRACFKAAARLFRIAAYEDLRHLLKHKRRYAPEALTPPSGTCSRARACRPGFGWRPASASTLGDARHVPLRRPRGWRPAPGARRAAARVDASRRIRRCATPPSSRFRTAAPASGFMPSSRRPACPKARMQDSRRRSRAGQTARAAAGGGGAAAQRGRSGAQRDPPARRHQPGRPDRPADREARPSAPPSRASSPTGATCATAQSLEPSWKGRRLQSHCHSIVAGGRIASVDCFERAIRSDISTGSAATSWARLRTASASRSTRTKAHWALQDRPNRAIRALIVPPSTRERKCHDRLP